MATTTAPTLAVDVGTAIGRKLSSFLRTSTRLARRKPLGAVGAAIVLFLIVMGGLGPVVAPFDPTEAGVVLGEDGRPERFKTPGFNENLLGGDRFARDVLSRLLHGARISLMVGVAATVLGCSVGAVLGVVSGYVGGKVDAVLSQLNNMILAFPVIIMAMALLSGLERNLFTIIVAIAIPMIPIAARVVRSTALVIKETQYVEAARAIGASSLRITFLHVMPGCLAPLLVITTSLIGVAILTEAFLGFLGLSIPPPRPTWGEMLSHSTQELTFAAHLSIAPGVAITLAVFAFNVVGDTMRDLLDPRLRGRA